MEENVEAGEKREDEQYDQGVKTVAAVLLFPPIISAMLFHLSLIVFVLCIGLIIPTLIGGPNNSTKSATYFYGRLELRAQSIAKQNAGRWGAISQRRRSAINGA